MRNDSSEIREVGKVSLLQRFLNWSKDRSTSFYVLYGTISSLVIVWIIFLLGVILTLPLNAYKDSIIMLTLVTAAISIIGNILLWMTLSDESDA